MRQKVILSRIINFINSNDDPVDTIRKYTGIAKYILYTNPDLIKSVCSKMKNNIEKWATKKSFVYKNYDPKKIYTREDLPYDSWYVNDPNITCISCNTSGSTTGERFSYIVTKKYHNFLENNNQYGMILKEFGLPKENLKILVLIKLANDPTPEKDKFALTHQGRIKHAYHGHGSYSSIRHFVNWDNYTKNLNKWHEDLINYISDKNLDLIISSGPIINGVKNYLQKNSIKIKLCKLLSHTSQFPIKQDFKFLKDNGYIDHYCDSMRCWDGGATFFTCKHENYHLMDNLSFCREIDKKLISTDYFSLPAPFINYWNGDLCEIQEQYKKCSCGRWYRPFKMLQNRPFALKGHVKLSKIKSKINLLSFKQKIKQVQFNAESINIIAAIELEDIEKEILQDILKEYDIKYIVY